MLLQKLQNLMGYLTVFLLLTVLSCHSKSPSAPTTEGAPNSAASQPAAGAQNNQPPIVSEVKITPASPRVGETLKAEVSASDPENNALTLRYQWMRNGQEISGEVQSFLPAAQARKGDQMLCEVTAYDGFSDSKPKRSEAITIQNSPPELSDLSLFPEKPSRETGLELKLTTSDADSDRVDAKIYWFFDGVQQDDLHGSQVEGSRLSKGMKVWAKIEASDGTAAVEKFTDRTTIGDAIPQITSKPPDIAPGLKTYTYQVIAHDADGDTLTYTAQGPAGVQITPQGLLTWDPKPDQGGLQKFQVEVKDKDGGSMKQSFEIMITFAPSAR